MFIEKIKLTNFRNYKEQELILDRNINIFYGNNAQGKTNFLESIYLCSIGKSYRTNKDKELVKKEEEFSKAEVNFVKKDRRGKISINISDKKVIAVNDIKLKRTSEVLGNLNIVLFSPEDINIFKDGPSRRRKIIDIMVSQLRPTYVHNINMYTNILEQRNTYLKQIKHQNKKQDMLEIWEIKLAEYAEIIHTYRKEFVEKIMEKIVDIHSKITKNKEKIKIEYVSEFETKEKFLNKIKANRGIDIVRGFTGVRYS